MTAPTTMPTCCPNLFYDDVAKAIAFLEAAFGFEKLFSHALPDGTVVHAQLGWKDAVFMLGPTKGGLRPIQRADKGPLHAAVYVRVDDVDEHCARARKHGAEVLLEPADMFWGDRIYCAVDLEGQFWTFAKHIRDVHVSPKIT
jgi:uncharacterized glyoxalase superfamily protein PhnB